MAKAKSCGLLESVKALPASKSKTTWFERLAPGVQAEIQVIVEQKSAGKIAASWAMIGKELCKQLELGVRYKQVAEDLAVMAKE